MVNESPFQTRKCVCKTLCPQPQEELRSLKENNSELHLVYAKYQDPSQNGSSVILSTRLFLHKMPLSEKGE